MNVSERYEAFQREAVNNIVADFTGEPAGRFLLVIPTGGGKTTTAVKAVSALYGSNVLREDIDRTIWVVHRRELKKQAVDTFDRFATEANLPHLLQSVSVLMLSEVDAFLSSRSDVRFVVVDEAHHVAAPSYRTLFERPSLGILGLTATPSRHDGRSLLFSRESFSIGFPDLVGMGVLLRPHVISVEGGSYDISDIGIDSRALELLNNDDRNRRIVEALLEHRDQLTKIIIYVGTKQHARDIYHLLRSSSLREAYESIGLILGDERRRWTAENSGEISGETREQFFEYQKATRRSILVNVDVLTEGYDDPTVNAVVMGRPTNSKLVYMQALGRAVRIDPANLEKAAYVIEVVDNLPNVNYRIDNRWLYSDISDALEPDVIDEVFTSPSERESLLSAVFERFNVLPAHRLIPDYENRDRLTMLLFKVYAGAGAFAHIPVVITNETRQAATAWFNYLSGKMELFAGQTIQEVFRPVAEHLAAFEILRQPDIRKYVFQSMENAWEVARPRSSSQQVVRERAVDGAHDAIVAGSPWITFVSFRRVLAEDSLGTDVLQFTEDMLNRDAVHEALRSDSYREGFYLVKFPLPLQGTWGVFLRTEEFHQLSQVVEALRSHATDPDGVSQWAAAMSIVHTATIAVEARHVQSMVTIVREGIDYFRQLPIRVERSQA